MIGTISLVMRPRLAFVVELLGIAITVGVLFLQSLRCWCSVASKPKKTEPLLVVSLGTICLTARALSNAEARAFAGPFDWIFSSPAVVAHIIEDDGCSFLDTAMYESLGQPNAGECAKIGHRVYSPMLRKDIVFNHHDPLNIPEDHAYFGRAFERLRCALQTTHLPLLCALFSIERRSPLVDEDLDRLLDVMAARYCGPLLDIVAVRILSPEQGTAVGVHEERKRCVPLRSGGVGTLTVVRLRCRGPFGPSALSLVDADDRSDLLTAVFGANSLRAGADGELCVAVDIAPDPLFDEGRAACQGRRFHKARKYADDGYLVAQSRRQRRI